MYTCAAALAFRINLPFILDLYLKEGKVNCYFDSNAFLNEHVVIIPSLCYLLVQNVIGSVVQRFIQQWTRSQTPASTSDETEYSKHTFQPVWYNLPTFCGSNFATPAARVGTSNALSDFSAITLESLVSRFYLFTH